MSRPRNVEPGAAIASAMALFWQSGFECVSTREVEEKAGITRFTLQTSYGGKKALFLQTLDLYLNMFEAAGAPPGDANDLEAVAQWFLARTGSSGLPEAANNGCLMLNTIAEFGARDSDINVRIERYFTTVRGRFAGSLRRIRAAGGLPEDFAIEQKVEILVSCAIAMNMTIRAAGTSGAGASVAAAAAAMIREWAAR